MTVFVCDKCDSRFVGDVLPRRGSICFKCHLKTVNIGYTYGKENFHGDTIKQRQDKAISDAAKEGRTIEPIGNRWV
jgi:hypothetical protein